MSIVSMVYARGLPLVLAGDTRMKSADSLDVAAARDLIRTQPSDLKVGTAIQPRGSVYTYRR
jgi:hypothetical protein